MRLIYDSSRLFSLKASSLVALAFFLTITVLTKPAVAYFSTMDTGETIAPGAYQIMVEPQLILNRHEGLNINGRFETGLDDSSSLQGVLGLGTIDFHVGGFYKFIPFPDTANQPAIGGKVGVIYARNDGESEFSVRLHPLVSKRFETEIGDLTAFGSIPFGVTNRTGGENNFVPVQVAAGAELRTLDWPRLSFMTELGVNVNRSFSYLSVGLTYRFDDTPLRRRQQAE